MQTDKKQSKKLPVNATKALQPQQAPGQKPGAVKRLTMAQRKQQLREMLTRWHFEEKLNSHPFPVNR